MTIAREGENMANQKMQLGLNFTQQKNLRDVATWYEACDRAGLTVVGTPDSPALLRELYVSTTVAALATEKVNIMTMVTNPVTRHPSVTASAAMSLDELAPGRIQIGIATGDSALWATKQKAAKVADLKEYILAVKALLRGEPATYRGETFEQAWSNWEPRNVPIYVACSGPRVLSMASQVADGVVVTMGFARENVELIQATIHRACGEVGRDPDTVDFWSNAQITFDESKEKAMEYSLGWTTNWLTEGTLSGKGIPPEIKEPLLKMNEDIHNLEAVYKTPDRGRIQVQRAKDLGIYDWIIEHSPRLWGTPDDIYERLTELADMGLTNWVFLQQSRGTFVGGADAEKLELIKNLGEVAKRVA